MWKPQSTPIIKDEFNVLILIDSTCSLFQVKKHSGRSGCIDLLRDIFDISSQKDA